jgi:5-methylcytosine-specific restriction endonuclease McrA
MGYSDPDKQREYTRKWIAARRKEWFEGKQCVSCGSALQLQLDHIDPSKKVSHYIWSWAAERRMKELAKCQVLCSGCHKAKTAKDRADRVEHGSYTMYHKHHCRCVRCYRYKQEHNAKFR